MCNSHLEAWGRRCDGALLVALLLVSYSNFKACLTARLPQHSAATCHPVWCALTGNPEHTSRLRKGYWTKKGEWWSSASDDLASTIARPWPDWNGLGWIGPRREGKATNKCSASLGASSRLFGEPFQVTTTWSWLSECQGTVIKAKRGYFKECKI